jgi:hypothetical protein
LIVKVWFSSLAIKQRPWSGWFHSNQFHGNIFEMLVEFVLLIYLEHAAVKRGAGNQIVVY